jgi:uncharacterized membrane protein HdeD (DUF308 family)
VQPAKHEVMTPDHEESRFPLPVFFLVRGVIALVAGILLLVWPDRTLLLVGVILGVALIAFGVTGVVQAFSASGRLAMERAIPVTVGLLAIAAGIVVIARPDSSVKVVAVAAGIYLIVAGIAAGMSAINDPDIRASQGFLAVLWIVTGIVILVWPDVTVTVLAVVFGISLVLRGIAEILLSIVLGRQLKKMQAGDGSGQGALAG